MPVAADLKVYQSANMPESDATTSGGAIAATGTVEFTDLAANDTLEAVSSNAADTMNITVHGRSAAGAIVSETKALTGITAISLSTLGTVERFLKALLAVAAAGTITIRRATGGATVASIVAGVTSVRRMFYDSASESGATTRFEKIFLKNTHATQALSSAAVQLTADPSTSVRIGCEAAVDGTQSVANRKTTPTSVTFVDDGVSQGVPGGSLAAGSAIGVWVEFVRGAGAAAVKSTFTVQLSGTSV